MFNTTLRSTYFSPPSSYCFYIFIHLLCSFSFSFIIKNFYSLKITWKSSPSRTTKYEGLDFRTCTCSVGLHTKYLSPFFVKPKPNTNGRRPNMGILSSQWVEFWLKGYFALVPTERQVISMMFWLTSEIRRVRKNVFVRNSFTLKIRNLLKENCNLNSDWSIKDRNGVALILLSSNYLPHLTQHLSKWNINFNKWRS